MATLSSRAFDRKIRFGESSMTPAQMTRLNQGFVTSLTKKLPQEYLVDRLRITIKAEYQVKRDALFYWKTDSAIHEYRMLVKYPDGFRASSFAFVFDTSSVKHADAFKCGSWVMPDQGVAWRIDEGKDERADSLERLPH
jgi:hypothetical protein